jgi:hypothetical protein
VYTVAYHQQPTRQSRFDEVKAIAPNGFSRYGQLGIGVAV